MKDEFVLRHLYSDGEQPDMRLIQSQFITAEDVWRIADFGVRVVIDLSGMGLEDDDDRAAAEAALAAAGIARVHFPVDGPEAIDDACGLVAEHLEQAFPTGSVVVVHCSGGVDRSVCVATAVRAWVEDRDFTEELARMYSRFPGIAPTRTFARPAARWTTRASARPAFPPRVQVRCPRCGGAEVGGTLNGGLCDTPDCTHTACPFCADGRGTADDGCPHLVLELTEGTPGHSAFTRTGAMPWLTELECDERWPLLALMRWRGTPEDPWPDGITAPPSTGVLQMVALMMADCPVVATDIPEWDFDEDLQPITGVLIRAYAPDPAKAALCAEAALDGLARTMDHFGPVDTGVTS